MGRIRSYAQLTLLGAVVFGSADCARGIPTSSGGNADTRPTGSRPTATPAAPMTASEALEHGFQAVFGERRSAGRVRRRRSPFGFQYSTVQSRGAGGPTTSSRPTSGGEQRRTEDYYAADDAVADDDGAGNNDDDGAVAYDDDGVNEDEACSQYLVSFLEGTTDAKDTCEGIMNAYTAADCQTSDNRYHDQNVIDDYFEDFYEHSCCQSLMSHHAEYCEESSLLSNIHLLTAALVLLLCECAKVLVKRLNVHFLPEAAVCILVGTIIGLLAKLLPGASIEDMVFDEELFMSVLLPPIIFEAALSVSKSQFKRRRGAIMSFAVLGTIVSTFTTGLSVHYVSKFSKATTFPALDSLVFGALISSIDPVAILSVLTSLNLSQTDTIFILVFGESLLNDGIAITVFKTLVARFDGKTNDGSTDVDEILGALADFLLAMFGSIAMGLLCGCCAWIFFYFLERNLHPVMEVGSFFLWALVPYYICEALEWSGIVAIVAMAFVMDIYIAAPKKRQRDSDHSAAPSDISTSSKADDFYVDMGDGLDDGMRSVKSFATGQSIQPIARTERIRLSATADRHVRFVAHLTAQLAENAIFAYLGLFLLSSNYVWDVRLCTIAVASAVLCRALMVIIVSSVIWHTYRFRGRASRVNPSSCDSLESRDKVPMSRTAAAVHDRRTQLVLVLAGLRGAVSMVLVENVPIYNSVTGEGCEYKPLMKAMTSSSIIFTTFVFGGGAYYILPHLGISPDRPMRGADRKRPSVAEVISTLPSSDDPSSVTPVGPRRGPGGQIEIPAVT
eukprot:CAMPEP_0178530770 /NCGR_PEP_ID=MMETSP0696-20121128/33070_1 /TAXON_ID=265572 /ORGANISM="Extubocellulus spinifer, Strain CCMP396" /LENGTH=786 /DNA_ID=CAMNT_0020162627 /DNA_START=259 /DNA_END=2619 /DNA_ORIENTATION=+